MMGADSGDGAWVHIAGGGDPSDGSWARRGRATGTTPRSLWVLDGLAAVATYWSASLDPWPASVDGATPLAELVRRLALAPNPNGVAVHDDDRLHTVPDRCSAALGRVSVAAYQPIVSTACGEVDGDHHVAFFGLVGGSLTAGVVGFQAGFHAPGIVDEHVLVASVVASVPFVASIRPASSTGAAGRVAAWVKAGVLAYELARLRSGLGEFREDDGGR